MNICGNFYTEHLRYFNKDSIFLSGSEKFNTHNFDSALLQKLKFNNDFNSLSIYVNFFSTSKIEIQELFGSIKKSQEKLYKYISIKRFKTDICYLNKLQKDSFLRENHNDVILPYTTTPPPEYINVRHSRHN